MNKQELALIKIEEAFSKITGTFDQRMARVVRAEKRRIETRLAERRKKRAAQQAELIAQGLPIRKSLLDAEIRSTKAIFEIPEFVIATQDRSHLLAYVTDLDNLKIHLEEYCKFLAGLKESNNLILYETAYELLPKTQKLLSLMHIYKAHPDDAIKRAHNIVNPGVNQEVEKV